MSVFNLWKFSKLCTYDECTFVYIFNISINIKINHAKISILLACQHSFFIVHIFIATTIYFTAYFIIVS